MKSNTHRMWEESTLVCSEFANVRVDSNYFQIVFKPEQHFQAFTKQFKDDLESIETMHCETMKIQTENGADAIGFTLYFH